MAITWRDRIWTIVAIAALALLLAGCNTQGPSVAGVPGLQWQLQRFYLDKATEAGGMCTAPAIRSITQSTILEETEEQLVLRVRYFWRDEQMRQDYELLPLTGAISCQGFAERDFTLAKMSDGSLQVVSMTGEMRNVQQNFGTRSGSGS
jgi:hypothetical protein